MKTLICTVGLPRSGKSTWCWNMTEREGYPIVNPDAIRFALYGQRFWAPGEKLVWAQAELMVRTLFHTGYDIVLLDATNTTRKTRDMWSKRTTGTDTVGNVADVSWSTLFHYIPTPPHICIERAMATNQLDLIEVIQKMSANYEPLQSDEEIM